MALANATSVCAGSANVKVAKLEAEGSREISERLFSKGRTCVIWLLSAATDGAQKRGSTAAAMTNRFTHILLSYRKRVAHDPYSPITRLDMDVQHTQRSNMCRK